MTKIQGSERLRPRLSVSERCPYVRMSVLLTAVSVRGSGERRRSAGVGGMTLTSEPVSAKNRVLVCASVTNKRRLAVGPVTPVAANVPKCKGPGTSWHQLRICGDTNSTNCLGLLDCRGG